jgi:3-phenylpropionate/trans-cinnamate dioxygenase ferredoxin reductase subunit
VSALPTFVVIGAGLAAGKAVQELREGGFGGHLVLYGAEDHLPVSLTPIAEGLD